LPPVVLINTPFAAVNRPSLGLGILQAVLKRHRIASRVLYVNLLMAERCGLDLYEQIARGALSGPPDLFGEWLFSPWLFSDHPSQEDMDVQGEDLAFVRRVFAASPLSSHDLEVTSPVAIAKVLRKRIPGFLDACLRGYDWRSVRLVGLTSTFQQHVCALVLGRLIRGLQPHAVVVMGGANLEGAMGRATLEAFPWVDCVVSGEGERVIIPLARAAVHGEDWRRIPGLLAHGQVGASSPLPVSALGRLPYPEYRDYFDQLSRRPVLKSPTFIPAETSRGCWWGERCQCTFCGLNGERMKYRHKRPGRALRELRYLWRRYGENAEMILLADNNAPIQPYSETRLFSRLERVGARLACEVKVSLTKEQMSKLKWAGFREVQPGIESLSSKVLGLMRKGTTALLNVQFLKWALEFGIGVNWHVIWGFPNELSSEYERTARLVPRLAHLPPPLSLGPVRLDRFSPMFNAPSQFDICDLRPKDSYRLVYKGLPLDVVRRLAYYFDFTYLHPLPEGYETILRHAIAEWRHRHAHAGLFYFPLEAMVIVVDTRQSASIHAFEAPWGQLLDSMDTVIPVDALAQRVGTDLAALEAKLQFLDQQGWILREGNKVIGLPVRLGEYQPSAGVISAMSSLLDETGTMLRPVRRMGGPPPTAQDFTVNGPERGSPRSRLPAGGHRVLTASMFGLGAPGTLTVDSAVFAGLRDGEQLQLRRLATGVGGNWASVDYF
jgi:ribosomal peptide maturation radical SAM protein 1